MKIIVCIKPIPDSETAQIDVKEEAIKCQRWTINPVDFSILEEGIKLKEKFQGEVIAISLAPPSRENLLKQVLLMGADRVIRAWNESCVDTNSWIKSAMLSEVVEKVGFDLILCGCRSYDTSSEFVGAALAERLKLPFVTRVVSLTIVDDWKVVAHKKLEKGRRETYRCLLPAVLSLDESINEPRYVPLFGKIYQRGLKKSIEVFELDSCHSQLPTSIKLVKIGYPKPRAKAQRKIKGLTPIQMMRIMRAETDGKREIFSGPPDQAAEKIVNKLREWFS